MEEIDSEPQEDFNFDIYGESDEGKPIDIEKKPEGSYLRARFPNNIRFHDTIANIRDELVKYSILIRSGSNDLSNFRQLYGRLDAIWSLVEFLQGTKQEDKINEVRDYCLKLINDSNSKPHPELREYILYFEKMINKVTWHCNLNLAVETINTSTKTKDLIIN